MYNLKVFGLNISCEFSIPELLVTDNESTFEPDVVIKFGKISKHVLGDVVFKAPYFQTNEKGFLFGASDIVKYLVQNGKEITIDMSEKCSMEQMQTNLLGLAMTALLMQRNLTIFHGNAINVGGNGISFSGNSGSGKSVISAAFMQQGYSVLADDMCVIDRSTNMIPGFPKIKLRNSSCEKLGLNPSDLEKVHKDHEKRFFPLNKQFYAQNIPLKLMYVLNKHDEDNIEFHEEIENKNKVFILKNQSIFPNYLKGLKKEAGQLKRLASIAPEIKIVRLSLPKSGFDIHELMNLTLKDIEKRGFSTGCISKFQQKKSLETEYETCS